MNREEMNYYISSLYGIEERLRDNRIVDAVDELRLLRDRIVLLRNREYPPKRA